MKGDAWDTAMERAAALRNAVVWQSNEANTIIAKALLEAEQRGRKAGLEEAAKECERLLTFADTTSNADKAISAAIRAKANGGGE